jgi:uncharacterized membrane protein YdjX (TVP38/TMEM64 family)
MKIGHIDLRVWLPRLALIGAAAAAYYLAVHFGWAPANPMAWLFEIGDRVKDELPKFGILAPVIYTLFYALQIVVAPIPGAPLAYTAGFLFGPVAASIYSMIGILFGGAMAFLLARRLGFPLIEKMAPKSWIERWQNLAAVNSSITWFLLMLAPTADVFYFIAGLTKLSFRRFMLIVLLGRTPGIILSSIVGANVETFGAQWIFILIGIMLLISLAGNWLRQRVEKRALLDARGAEVESDI